MGEHRASIEWINERAVRVTPPIEVSPPRRRDVLRGWRERIESACIPGVYDIVIGQHAITVTCDPGHEQAHDLKRFVLDLHLGTSCSVTAEPRLIEIPVCYEGPHAMDLSQVAALAGMSERTVIDVHSGAAYSVSFLGFAPGFAYLSGLPETLRMPRLDTPRTRVPRGSVGIGGATTGVYPFATPGGWRIIGRTPIRLFDASKGEPALLRPGDQVKFTPITSAEFERLKDREHGDA